MNKFFKIFWAFIVAFIFGVCGFSAGFLYGTGKIFSKLPIVNFGENIEWTSKKVRWDGWSYPEKSHRWSSGKFSQIVFRIKEEDLKKNSSADVELFLNIYGTLGEQRVTLKMNENIISSENNIFSGKNSYNIIFSKKLLKIGDNHLQFNLPDASQPGNGDKRLLALGIKDFSIKDIY